MSILIQGVIFVLLFLFILESHSWVGRSKLKQPKSAVADVEKSNQDN